MNVLQNLTELYNTLPLDNTYRNVAKGILEHLDQMQDVTIYDIAEITNASRTTVWRMIQKLGYGTFSEFRHALQSASQQYNYYNRILPAGACRDADSVLHLVCSQLQESVEILEQGITPELLQDVTAQLHRASKIRFYMPFRLPMIGALQQNLSKDGKDTAYFCLLPDMLENAHTLDENSIVIASAIEHAETLDLHRVFSTAQARGAVIWWAGTSQSQYRSFADQMILDIEADSLSWLSALNALILAISEFYRATYIDLE